MLANLKYTLVLVLSIVDSRK